MQMASILAKNKDAKIFAISSQAHQGITELLRELAAGVAETSFPRDISRLERSRRIFLHRRSDLWSTDPRGSSRRDGSPGVPVYDVDDTTAGPEKWRSATPADLPTISLKNDQLKDTWQVAKDGDKFVVTGEKIEKFARRTDLNNYESLNRLRDIMKKMGIHAELTSQGAEPDSIIEIAGKEFTLVEDW